MSFLKGFTDFGGSGEGKGKMGGRWEGGGFIRYGICFMANYLRHRTPW